MAKTNDNEAMKERSKGDSEVDHLAKQVFIQYCANNMANTIGGDKAAERAYAMAEQFVNVKNAR